MKSTGPRNTKCHIIRGCMMLDNKYNVIIHFSKTNSLFVDVINS